MHNTLENLVDVHGLAAVVHALESIVDRKVVHLNKQPGYNSANAGWSCAAYILFSARGHLLELNLPTVLRL